MASVDLTPFLQLASLGIAGVLAVLAAAVGSQHVWRKRSDERRAQREGALRPLIMRALANDEPDLTVLDHFTGPNRRTLEALVWSLLPKVRGASRDALVGWLDRGGAIEEARRHTRSRESVRRSTAAERLGAAGVASTASDVEMMLDDRSQQVRVVAARALGKLGHASAVEPLLNSLSGPKAVPVSVVTMALLHIGPAAEPGLLKALSNRQENARGVCVDLLGMHGAIAASAHIAALLQYDDSTLVRTKAASALGRLGVPQAVEPLTRAITPTNPNPVRKAAATALGEVGGAAALGALQLALNDDDDEVGVAAACALMRLGAKGKQILDAAAEGQGPAVGRAIDWCARLQVQAGVRRHRDRSLAQSISRVGGIR